MTNVAARRQDNQVADPNVAAGGLLKSQMNAAVAVEAVAAVTNLAAACLHRHHRAGLSEAVDIAKTHQA